jgi:hypothetical protein
MRRARSVGSLTLALWIGGCATTAAPGTTQQLLAYNRLDRTDGGSSAGTPAPLTICVVPSLQTALMVTSRILADGNTRLAASREGQDSDARIVELAGRTHASLVAIGADLSRLCSEWSRRPPSPITVSAPGAAGAVDLTLLPVTDPK